MTTFVSVGNATQPFYRLLDAVCAIAKDCPQPVIIQHGSAHNYFCPNCQNFAFMSMPEFTHHIASAELLILHAGAGSVIHAIQSGKIPVIMPRRSELNEHVDDHQLEFCRQLEKTDKALIANDTETLLDICKLALSRQQLLTRSETTPPLVDMIHRILHTS